MRCLIVLLTLVVLLATPAPALADPDGAGRPGAAADTLAVEPSGPDGPDATGLLRRADGVQLEGRGYGHGRGLSQYGAQGAATEFDRTYRQILRFYYPGLTIGTRGGRLRVLLTADTTTDVVVAHARGLRVRAVGGRTWRLRHAGAKRWRITPAAGGAKSRVWVKADGWQPVRTVRGQAEFLRDAGPLTLITPAGRTRYAGTLRSVPGATGRDTVNVVSLEAYLRGVVPREVPALWHPQAVRAQAVAARSYAVYERAHSTGPYDLCDTSSCQVYGGVGDAHPASDRAIRATRAQVLLADGAPAFTQFSASNGGWTVAGSVPYQQAREDPWDPWSGNPYRHWTQAISAAAIENAYPHIGTFERIAIPRRDGNGAWGGRALRVRIVGSADTSTVSGDTFRVVFGLRSTWFRVAS